MTDQLLRHHSPGVRFETIPDLPIPMAHVRVWAPFASSADLCHTDRDLIIPLEKDGQYWHTSTLQLQPGDCYTFRLNGTLERPDPASLAQPTGVHGPSQAHDVTRFVWTDETWHNLPLEDYLIYELHTGTFTPEGTFAAMETRLDYLRELGINAIEIMPVAQFPGNRNWGYDGVYPYAVQNSYGGAVGLQHLVNAAHERGLTVILDVVYNHMGPEGNYFTDYGPYFTQKYETPWGVALNFDDTDNEAVREYFIENVLMWFRDFHIDALRLDAVHAIHDHSDLHILSEIRQRVDRFMAETGQQHYLIIESDLNETRFIEPLAGNGYGMDAQWNDEFHHALRVTAGGERSGYYAEYDGIKHLAKSFRDAYVYDGIYSPGRGRVVGKPTAELYGRQFIVFSRNHDQIGNRMLGERIGQLFSFPMQKLMAGTVMSSPYLPMLFMGEEWGALSPFSYFISHTDPALVETVREGRKAEFAAFHTDVQAPDPQAEITFTQSRLDWYRLAEEPHLTLFRYYQNLLALRKNSPLRHPNRESVEVHVDEETETLLIFRQHDGERVACMMNFANVPRGFIMPDDCPWQKLLDSADPIWHGNVSAPDRLEAGTQVDVQAESILIYTSAPV